MPTLTVTGGTRRPPQARFQVYALLAVLASLALLAPRSLHGQIDYRNLDDDRPTRVEDAYPIERYAFEWILPWHFEAHAGPGTTQAVIPELSYGLLRNVQIGLKAPIAFRDEGATNEWGLSGIRLFGLYNVNTESPSLPALSVRADVTLPVGGLAANAAQVSLKALATRSWGRNRIHLNVAYALGRVDEAAAVEGLPRWWAGVAMDRTFFRQSLLLVGEVFVHKPETGARAEVTSSAGVRYQLTPTTVLDLGISQGLHSNRGPQPALTIGLSRAFAIRALMPNSGVR